MWCLKSRNQYEFGTQAISDKTSVPAKPLCRANGAQPLVIGAEGIRKKYGIFSESGREKKSKFATAIDSITKECITEINHF